MAYDEKLAERIRNVLAPRVGLSERKMFGGLAFMLNGNMCCGLTADALMVRVGPDRFEEALAEPHARPMDFTGRPMKGMVYVDPAAYASDEGLAAWVKRGVDFAASLPPK
jgi:TfoX/Sxy family transcriptional regulator of competence genes